MLIKVCTSLYKTKGTVNHTRSDLWAPSHVSCGGGSMIEKIESLHKNQICEFVKLPNNMKIGYK